MMEAAMSLEPLLAMKLDLANHPGLQNQSQLEFRSSRQDHQKVSTQTESPRTVSHCHGGHPAMMEVARLLDTSLKPRGKT